MKFNKCNETGMESFLKRVDKLGGVSQQEVNDSGTSRDTLEYIKFREFRRETESMMSLLKVRVDGGPTLQSLFRKLPDGAMFDAIINYNPDTKGKQQTSNLPQISFSSELDDFLVGAVSMRLSGDRRRAFRTGQAPQRFISGLCALAAEFQVSKATEQRRARQALLELKLTAQTPIASSSAWRYPLAEELVFLMTLRRSDPCMKRRYLSTEEKTW